MIIRVLAALASLGCSAAAERAPHEAQSSPATRAPRAAIDGYKDFKFGVTIQEIESRRLCHRLTKLPIQLSPPEEAVYSCKGIPNPNRQAFLDSDPPADVVDSVDLTFVKGKLAGVAIPTGDSLSDFAATQTSLEAQFGEWYGDDLEPSAARRPEIQLSRAEAFKDGNLQRLVRQFVGGAVRLIGTRPDPREPDVLLVRVAYVDVPAYRAAGPGVSERDSRRSNSP